MYTYCNGFTISLSIFRSCESTRYDDCSSLTPLKGSMTKGSRPRLSSTPSTSAVGYDTADMSAIRNTMTDSGMDSGHHDSGVAG